MEQELEKKLKEISLENENWKPCPEFENKYLISNYGRILGIGTYNTCKKYDLIKQHKKNGRNGYMQVRLYDNGRARTIETHTLVAKAFIPNPNNLPMVNHKDEDKTNNKVSNLEWCNCKYNVRYSNAIKVDVYDLNGNLIETLESISDAAKKYNISTADVCRSCKSKKYSSIHKLWQFRYSGDAFIYKPIPKSHNKNGLKREDYYKKVIKYDLLGNKITEYPNITKAAQDNNDARSNIRKCCKREVKTSLGFIYAFPNDDIQERVNELSQRKHLSKTESYELQRKSKIQ